MKERGEQRWFLGIRVEKARGRISLVQEQFKSWKKFQGKLQNEKKRRAKMVLSHQNREGARTN